MSSSDREQPSGISLFEQIESLSTGVRNAAPKVLAELQNQEDLTGFLLGLALQGSGTPEEQGFIQSHFAEPEWSKWLPLDAQEYSAVFCDNRMFEMDIRSALRESGWASRHLHALGPSQPSDIAAKNLLQDLRSIAHEAAEIVRVLPEMRRRRTDRFNMLQVQALLRIERVVSDVTGLSILEVGTHNGGLLLELRRLGAHAIAVDLQPVLTEPFVLRGDFMTAEVGGPFDAIVATGVFENASCTRGEPTPHPGMLSPTQLLARLHSLLKGDGIVVLENICLPLPFSHSNAEASGFEVIQQLLPGVNLNLGGRGCCLRRRRIDEVSSHLGETRE